jgi:hypothetical protein
MRLALVFWVVELKCGKYLRAVFKIVMDIVCDGVFVA